VPLPPEVQEFDVDATAYLAGIDRMIENTDRLAGSIGRVTDAMAGMSGGSMDASGALGRMRNSEAEAATAADQLEKNIRSAGVVAGEAAVAGAAAMDEYRNKIAETLAVAAELENELDGIRDKSGQGALGIGLLDKAMSSARDRAAELAAAGTLLNLDLAATDDLAKKARNALIEMGLSETEAAAAAVALAGAQSAADAAMDASSGAGFGVGFFSKIADFGPGGIIGTVSLLAAAIPVIGAVVAEVSALAGGFTAAGLGVGAMAALAIPAFDRIKNGYTGLHAAQAAYHAAVELEKRDPTKDNAEAVATALAKEKIAWASLSPATRRAIHGIDGLKSSYEGMAKAFEPDAFKLFDQGLRIANELLPNLKPFADTAATAVSGLLGKLAGFVKPAQDSVKPLHDMSASTARLMGDAKQQPTGFQKFVADLHSMEGPAIKAIGTDLGNVATNLGKFITSMPPKDVTNGINIAFRILSGTIDALTWTTHRAMTEWDSVSRAFHDTRQWTDDVVGWVGRMSGDVRHDFDEMVSDVEHLWDSGWSHVESTARTIPGKINAAFMGLPGELLSIGKSAIDGLINGIESMAGSLLSKAESIASSVISAFKSVLKVASPSKVMTEIGLEIGRGLIKGLEGTAAQVKASSDTLASIVEHAFEDKLISAGTASYLTDFIERDNTRLRRLANERKKILAEIANAKKYAASVTSTMEGSAGLAGLASVQNAQNGAQLYSGDMLSNLQSSLAKIRQFSAAIKRLAKLGLHRGLLNQIIQMGPDQGLQVAESLLEGPVSVIKQMDQTQTQINDASKAMGKSTADMMYDSGKQAGKGFLSGLEGQQKAIEKMMKKIARSMVDVIRKELGIKSPSTVARYHGQMWSEGLALGIEDGQSRVAASSKRLTSALTGAPARSTETGGAGAGGGGTQIGPINVKVSGFIGSERELATQIWTIVQQEALKYNKRNGLANNGLSLASGRFG
jgi:hypothetical protein